MPWPWVCVVDKSTKQFGVAPEALVAALQRYADEHLFPVWGVTGVLELAGEVRPGALGLVLLDEADAAQALGYHDLTPDGLPMSKVFVATTLRDGQRPSVTAAHELAEMLVDPALDVTVQGPDGVVYAYEICDPVEGSELEIDGVPLASFVYPSWFQAGWPPGSVQFDHLGAVSAPFGLLPHGYMPVFEKGKWSRVFGSIATEAAHAGRDARGHRRERRGREQRRSTKR